MFIACNKRSASDPSREGKCCCWHCQRGAVRAPGRGGPCDLGGQAVAANVIGSGPTQAQAFPSCKEQMLSKASCWSLQRNELAVGRSALLCAQGTATQGAPVLIATHRGLPQDTLGCWGGTSACFSISLPAKGSSPAPLHPGSTAEPGCRESLCFYPQHPFLVLVHFVRYQREEQAGQSQKRPFKILR